MKIVVVNTAASSGGALSILKDFYQYLRENDTSNQWVFLLSDYYIEETENITVEVIKDSKKKINRLKFDNLSGYKLINRYNPDLVFSMQNTTVANLSVPQILYLHQSIPFQDIKNYSFFKVAELKYAFIQHLLGANIKYGLRRANTTIVQTNWMKEAIMNQVGIESEHIEVIPPTVKIDKKVKKTEEQFNKFFYPSASAPYKNNKLIEQACDYIDRKYPELNFEVQITVDERFNNNHIQSIGQISREKVFEKMLNEVLIFPSYIETFGLPLAEARALNSIIFASNTPFSREVLEGYKNAYFFDPFNAQELGELMVSNITKKIVKNKDNKYNYQQDSWEKVTEIIYQNIH